MTKESAGFVALTSGLSTLLLLIIGAGLWRTPPSAAEEAVGKGIVTLAGVAAITMFCSLTVYLDKRDAESRQASRAKAAEQSD
jgi:hypothetical protein